MGTSAIMDQTAFSYNVTTSETGLQSELAKIIFFQFNVILPDIPSFLQLVLNVISNNWLPSSSK